MTLSRKIRELRAAAGMSLTDLEKRSGISKGYLSQLERGDADNPSIQALLKLSDALGADPVYLLGTENGAAAETGRLPAGLQQLIDERGARGDPLKDEDVRMLLAIKYRGQRPRTAEDWDYLYETIRRVVGRRAPQ